VVGSSCRSSLPRYHQRILTRIAPRAPARYSGADIPAHMVHRFLALGPPSYFLPDTVYENESTPAGEEFREWMAQQLEHPLARARYRRRKVIVEPCFAELRERQGLKRFHRRGLKAVRVEFALHCIAFNLKRAVRQLAPMDYLPRRGPRFRMAPSGAFIPPPYFPPDLKLLLRKPFIDGLTASGGKKGGLNACSGYGE
jgi:hypothetical protein